MLASSEHHRRFGFSLVEMLIALMVFALVATFAVPAYRAYVVRAESAKAISDIGIISIVIERYRLNNGDNSPPNLNAIDREWLDPWGAPYVYVNLAGANRGAARKNKNLVPLNTDYDLYSMGPDGQSAAPLTAKKKQR
ncbi:MAG: prepilin-type N-terminal cleavage/methylation domain-containing protein [Gammaproteobacteria bacterium]|nr:prepilin-type N-terminal cleavage/methylation domain-containing protein [Gammaproteobacteria bacterium]